MKSVAKEVGGGGRKQINPPPRSPAMEQPASASYLIREKLYVVNYVLLLKSLKGDLIK